MPPTPRAAPTFALLALLLGACGPALTPAAPPLDLAASSDARSRDLLADGPLGVWSLETTAFAGDRAVRLDAPLFGGSAWSVELEVSPGARGTLFSYATAAQADAAALTIGSGGELEVVVAGQRAPTGVTLDDEGERVSLAIAWRSHDGFTQVVVDGRQVWRGAVGAGQRLERGGAFVVGAAQSSPGAAHGEALVGRLGQVALHGRALDSGALRDRALVAGGLRPPSASADALSLELVAQHGHTDPVRWIEAAPDGRLALTSGEGETKLWTMDTRVLLRSFDCGGPARFDPTGRYVACLTNTTAPDGESSSYRVDVFEASTGRHVATHDDTGYPWFLGFIDDDALVVGFDIDTFNGNRDVGRAPQVLRLTDTGQGTARLEASAIEALDKTQVQASGAGGWLAVLRYGGTLDAVRVGDDLELTDQRHLMDDANGYDPVAFDPHGRLVAVDGRDIPVTVVDLTAGPDAPPAAEFPRRTFAAESLAWTHDGRLAIGTNASSAMLWDPAADEVVADVSHVAVWEHGATGGVAAVAAAPDGSTLLTSAGGRGARLWDTATASSPGDLGVDTDIAAMHRAGDLEFSPDARRLLVVDARPGGDVQVWDVKRGRLEHIFGRHAGCVDVLDDHRVFVGAGVHDGASWAEIWDYTTGLRLPEAPTGQRCQTSAETATSPDGRLVARHGGGVVTLEQVDGGAPVHLRASGEAWVAFTDDARFGASNGGARLLVGVQGVDTTSLDQIALEANRPDLIVERLGGLRPPFDGLADAGAFRARLVAAGIDPDSLEAAHRADVAAHARYVERHETRLRRAAGTDATSRLPSRHRARVEAVGAVDALGAVELEVTIEDSVAWQLYVDGVPELDAPEPLAAAAEPTVVRRTVQLTPGRNRIEVSGFDADGVESLRDGLVASFALSTVEPAVLVAGEQGVVEPDELLALVATMDWEREATQLRLVDLVTGADVAAWSAPGNVELVGLTRAAKIAIVRTQDGLELVDPRTGAALGAWPGPDAWRVHGLAGDGARVLVEGESSEVWDLDRGQRLATLPPAWLQTVSVDGRRVAGYADGGDDLVVWSLDDGRELARFAADGILRKAPRFVGDDGARLAWVDEQGIAVVDLATSEEVLRVAGEFDPFSGEEDGDTLFVAEGVIGTFRAYDDERPGVPFYDLETGEHRFDFEGGELVRNGWRHRRTLTWGGGDGVLQIVDMKASLRGHLDRIARRRALEPTLYFLGFGVSSYADEAIRDLNYAHQDALDLAAHFGSLAEHYGATEIHTWTDAEVTAQAIDEAAAVVAGAKATDVVVVFVAGHGLQVRDADGQWRYVYLVHETRRDDVAGTGIDLADIEALAAATPARQRLFLVDTCESGEAEAQGAGEVFETAASRGLEPRTVRGFALDGAVEMGVAAADTAARPERDRFIERDLRRLTGAVVFTSSTGQEASYEAPSIENGFFTEALLLALNDPTTDRDGDGLISLAELRGVVPDEVSAATGALQNPTVDRDNIEIELGFPLPRPSP